MLCPRRISDIRKVRAPVRGEEGQRQEDHSHGGKDQDRFVSPIVRVRHVVLFDRAQLEELYNSRVSILIAAISKDYSQLQVLAQYPLELHPRQPFASD